MNKRLIMVAATATLAAVACSPTTTSGGGTGGSAKTLTVWTSLSGPQRDLFTQYGKDFERAHQGITVKIDYMSDDDMKQKVQAGLVAHNLPTIVQWYGGSFLTPLITAGALTDLTPYANADASWKSELLPGALDNYGAGGKTYMAPVESPVVELFYNKALFKKAGLAGPPATFDDLLAAVGKLKAAGLIPITLDGKDGWPLQQWFAYLAMRNGGATLVTDAMAGRAPWTAPPFVQAARQLKQLIDAGAFEKGYLGTGYDAAMSNYTGSRAGMILSGTWIMSSLAASENASVLRDTGFADFPLVPGGKGTTAEVLGGPNSALGISTWAPDKALAWEFIKGQTASSEAAKVAQKSLILVPNKITYDRAAVPAMYNDLVDRLSGYKTSILFWNELLPPAQNTAFTDLQNRLATGDVTPEKMMSDFAAYLQAHPVTS
ncbi:extracellular solute-binding protein [Nonomuraea sp. NPDC050536]|uniref:extracellular solute-binding protein n=1 Tax=Nonomuraea sp. NPDC050536 TaxID=3364366 RepID=UPI0037C6019E